MQQTKVITLKQQREDVFVYSDRLNDMSLSELLEEAANQNGLSKEKMLIAELANRLKVRTTSHTLEVA